MPCLCHERAVTNVLFCCRHSDPFGRATFVSHTYFSYYYHEWIAFRESSHVVMPCILVIISVRPRERVHNAFYPRLATKVVSRSIRKRPCCQQSVGCSKELLKIREIQPPRKSTSVAYLFDNVYNRNVRDVDKYLHVYCLNQYLFL